MTITADDVWKWMGSSSDRQGRGDADSNMTRVVTAVEELWLEQWSPALATRKVTFTESDDLVTLANHHFVDTDQVVLTRLSDGAPLENGVTYFVRDATADTFKLAVTSGGAALSISEGGTAYVWTAPRPTYIDQALIMQAAALYNRRTVLNGVVASTELMGPFRISRFDPDVQRLLDPGGWAVA